MKYVTCGLLLSKIDETDLFVQREKTSSKKHRKSYTIFYLYIKIASKLGFRCDTVLRDILSLSNADSPKILRN